ncbi:MAG: PLP-dependent aminotransferase family protein [archaeon]
MARDAPKFKTIEVYFHVDRADDRHPYHVLERILELTKSWEIFEKYWVQDFGAGDRFFLDLTNPMTEEEIKQFIRGHFNKLEQKKEIDGWRPFDRSIVDMFVPNIESINFNSLFSVTAQNMRSSVIRQLLAVLKEKDIISFAGGIPDPKSFPIEVIGSLLNDKILLKQNDFAKARRALQYDETSGLEELRLKTLEVAEKTLKIKDQTPHNIMITAGSQQALFGLAHILVNKWDSIVVEAPTYTGALGPFRMHTSKFHELELGMDGPKPSDLKKVLEKHHPKFVYLIPNFQNPAGVTTSLDARKEIYAVVCEHNSQFKGLESKYKTLIIEDDPYGSLRYEGKYLPPIKSFDTEDIVVYLGSFSKIFAPGIRLGCMIARKDIVDKLVQAKQSYDLHSSSLSQWLAYEFLMEGDIVSGHIKNIKKMYKGKRDAMLDALEESGLQRFGFRWTKPEGGMFLWLTGPDNFDANEVVNKRLLDKEYMTNLNDALKSDNPDFKEFLNRVAIVPGEDFYALNPETHKNTARVNFSKPTIENIAEGVRILSKALPESLGFIDQVK